MMKIYYKSQSLGSNNTLVSANELQDLQGMALSTCLLHESPPCKKSRWWHLLTGWQKGCQPWWSSLFLVKWGTTSCLDLPFSALQCCICVLGNPSCRLHLFLSMLWWPISWGGHLLVFLTSVPKCFSEEIYSKRQIGTKFDVRHVIQPVCCEYQSLEEFLLVEPQVLNLPFCVEVDYTPHWRSWST